MLSSRRNICATLLPASLHLLFLYVLLSTLSTSAAPIIGQEFQRAPAPSDPVSSKLNKTTRIALEAIFSLALILFLVYLWLGQSKSNAALAAALNWLSATSRSFTNMLSSFRLDTLFQRAADARGVVVGTNNASPIPHMPARVTRTAVQAISRQPESTSGSQVLQPGEATATPDSNSVRTSPATDKSDGPSPTA